MVVATLEPDLVESARLWQVAIQKNSKFLMAAFSRELRKLKFPFVQKKGGKKLNWSKTKSSTLLKINHM